jgi:divalent metal cation (Fe/Co/Zn/Cd) transporter
MRGGAIIVFVRFANPIRDPLLGAVISILLLKNLTLLAQEEER